GIGRTLRTFFEVGASDTLGEQAVAGEQDVVHAVGHHSGRVSGCVEHLDLGFAHSDGATVLDCLVVDVVLDTTLGGGLRDDGCRPELLGDGTNSTDVVSVDVRVERVGQFRAECTRVLLVRVGKCPQRVDNCRFVAANDEVGETARRGTLILGNRHVPFGGEF